MANQSVQLSILAQPQVSYRERYISELDPRRNRAQRFIRADRNLFNLDYPTIEIPKQLNNNNKRLYIRVTLITVCNEQIHVTCVHPYPIDTTENSVIKDADRNTLYFPITEEDFNMGRKSFRISRKKLIQHELKTYGQLRVLDTDEKDIQRLNDPTDARKLIELYQLGKSQLVFSLSELIYDNHIPIIYAATSTCSNTMTAMTATASTTEDDLTVRCVPQRGYWNGGEEILMVVPKLDKRKTSRIIFDHDFLRNEEIFIESVDTKTIAFTTPRLPIDLNQNQSIQIPIVIIQAGEEIARVNFLYHSFDRCLTCNQQILFDEQMDAFPINPDENIKNENGMDEK